MTELERRKEILAQSTEAIKQYLSLITVGIFTMDRHGNPEDPGSGTCIEINKRWFIATAGHVIKSSLDKIRILPHQGRITEETKINILSKDFIDDNHNDWGWLELEETEMNKIKGTFIDLNSIMINQHHFENDLVIINGFPKDWIKVNKPNIGFAPITYNTLTIPSSEWPSDLEYNTERDIVYNYPKEGNFENSTHKQMIMPDAFGISGGGIWKTNLDNQGPVWSTDLIKLIGIQIGKPKGHELLHGIQIQKWLRFLGKSDINIASVIDKTYF